MIELRRVTKRYHRRTALEDVTLAIKPHERVAICGHSGCGKTTLLRLIAGFERPDAGEILLNGEVASASDRLMPPATRRLAMVFQDLALWPHLTVEENLSFGLDRLFPDRARRQEEVTGLLRTLRLDGRGGAYPSQLSGGEQQRVALGRALARKPSILLLDEPLAHVDDELRDVLAECILAVQSRDATTLIYATHDRELAARLGDRTVLMSQGRIKRDA